MIQPALRRYRFWLVCALVAILPVPLIHALASQADGTVPAAPVRQFGVLKPDAAKLDLAALRRSGVSIRHIQVGWDRYEPQEQQWNAAYIAELRDEIARNRAAGFDQILGFGVQYPPAWLWRYPNSSYVNQYGDVFAPGAPGSGVNGINAVFNQTMRDRQARFVRQVLQDLGTDWLAIRLGWGHYGELSYPLHSYNGHANSYWAYDAIAQGRAPGLPAGMRPAPAPGWKPGTAPASNARPFAEWYLDSLKNYHDWQIATVRAVYPGRLAMLYPSWGVRPGQLDGAVARNLDGTTAVERNGELQRGHDFARFVAGITDPGVVLYTTWLDAPFGDDASSVPADWTPAHWLKALGEPKGLRVWGENTGRNSYADMQRSFERIRRYDVDVFVWAFHTELYTPPFASMDQLAQLIATDRRLAATIAR